MKIRIPFLITSIASLVLAASCSIAGDNQTQSPLTLPTESLYGIQLNQNKLTIHVKSNGCTEAAHFDVQVSAEDGQQTLLIVRNKPDRCRKMTRIIKIELDLPVTERSGYRLLNSLQPRLIPAK